MQTVLPSNHSCFSTTGQICSSHKIFFHTDAAQAVGKIPLNVNDMKIDLMSISGHKIYGPKGTNVFFFKTNLIFLYC